MSSHHCEKCGEKYINYFDYFYNWCKTCHINNFKHLAKNGNEKVDNLIQEMQLKINNRNGIVFEWIPYNQFDNIEKINKGDYATIYSAIWKGSPLVYDYNSYIRNSDKKVILKCLHDSKNVTSELLDEV